MRGPDRYPRPLLLWLHLPEVEVEAGGRASLAGSWRCPLKTLVVLVVGTIAMGATLVLLGKLVRPGSGASGWWGRVPARLRHGTESDAGSAGDPQSAVFEVLRVQQRLGVVAAQIQELRSPSFQAASAHRLLALEAAYDDLLVEACDLAEVPPAPPDLRGEDLRRYEEEALAERGWSW